MKLIVSSASIAALALVAPKYSNAAMAASVDAAYENKVVEQAADVRARSLGEECSFASSGLRSNVADIGILSCGIDFVCVEDGHSSLGGVCVSADLKHRDLQNTLTCTTKCTGTADPGFGDACKGTDKAIIDALPDNSCCGKLACAYMTGAIAIGAGSCIGAYSCYKAKDATIGNGSCTGDSIKSYDGTYGPYYGFPCAYMQGVVGDNSCYEYSACYQYSMSEYKFNVGQNSCRGQTSCAFSATTDGTLSIGNGSCNGYYACYSMYTGVGSSSCNAMMACELNAGVIGDNVCNTEGACRSNTAAPTATPTNPPTNPPTTKQPTSSPSTNLPATMSPTRAKSNKSTKGNKSSKASEAPSTISTKAPAADAPKSGKKNSKKN